MRDDKLGDPLAERVSGSGTLLFIINAAGVPTPAQQGAAGTPIRTPAAPGAPAPDPHILPWLTTSPDSSVDPSNYPTVHVNIMWNMTFGAP